MSYVLKVSGTYAVPVTIATTVEIAVDKEWVFDEPSDSDDLALTITNVEDSAIGEAECYVDALHHFDDFDIAVGDCKWLGDGPQVSEEEEPELSGAQKMALMGYKLLFDLDEWES